MNIVISLWCQVIVLNVHSPTEDKTDDRRPLIFPNNKSRIINEKKKNRKKGTVSSRFDVV
jgi:hypothetical protein